MVASGSGPLPNRFCSYNYVTTELELLDVITCDEKKSRANMKKHGISFESAQIVFDDPLHMSRQDRGVDGELRWQTMGLVGDMVVILVAHTLHGTVA